MRRPPIVTGQRERAKTTRLLRTWSRLPLAFKHPITVFLQLMREKLQQEEQRERQQQNAGLQYMQHRMGGPPAPTPAISAPQHYQNMQVPIEVLKVSGSGTGLEMKTCL